MYELNRNNKQKSCYESTVSQRKNQVDPFDEMFEFEANIEKHMTPAQKANARAEKLKAEFYQDGVWLKTAEQRAAFRLLDAESQRIATFGYVPGLFA